MKRIIDLILVVAVFFISVIPMILVALAVRLTSTGPVIYWSDRVGKNNKIFSMPKFRSMYVDTPAVATHLLNDPCSYLTPIGSFLRRTSLDEFPQLWSIFVGDMSFVGPRPALFNQFDLIELRDRCGVSNLLPGVTGWAQINGRDELSVEEKVRFDLDYLQRKSIFFDVKIILITVLMVFSRKGVNH